MATCILLCWFYTQEGTLVGQSIVRKLGCHPVVTNPLRVAVVIAMMLSPYLVGWAAQLYSCLQLYSCVDPKCST